MHIAPRGSDNIKEMTNEDQTQARSVQSHSSKSDDELDIHDEESTGIDISKKVGLHDNKLLERSFLTNI